MTPISSPQQTANFEPRKKADQPPELAPGAEPAATRPASANNFAASWLDVGMVFTILIGGFFYQRNGLFWSQETVGSSQVGDADFWWSGALHISRGLLFSGYGQGFRPGYFYLAGLPQSVLNGTFNDFHKLFLIVFLSACCFFYLAGRRYLGRAALGAAMLALVFSPFTAEWTATSTTDCAGLVLNMVALALFIATLTSQRPAICSSFSGLFFSLANLTRPLMAPIALVAGLELFADAHGKREKFRRAGSFVAAFLAPVLLWMGVQKAVVGEASISQNDASAFYSASDPKIQVWDSNIYEPVAKSMHLQCRNYAADATLNKEFWRRTAENYRHNFAYHLERLLPHMWAIANFNSRQATVPQKVSLDWILLRVFLAASIVAGVFAAIKLKRGKFGLVAASLLFAVSLLPHHQFAPFVLIGAVLPWFQPRSSAGRLVARFISLYWLTGVAALYFVGGTAGSFASFNPYITGLGYRLAEQFYFSALVLAFYLVGRTFPTLSAVDLDGRWQAISRTNRWAGYATFGPLVTVALLVVMMELLGLATVSYRAYANVHQAVQPFPSLAPILKEARIKFGGGSPGAATIDAYPGSLPPLKLAQGAGGPCDSTDQLFCGQTGELIWNLAGQKRTTIAVYQQSQISPAVLHPNRLVLDIPESVNAEAWRWRRGAFIVRNIPVLMPKTDYLWYVDRPVVRAFIPLAEDLKSFDLGHASWFPMRKYATDLVTSGDLDLSGCDVMYDERPGHYPRRRHFLLIPKKGSSSASLILHTAHASSRATLSFAVDRNMTRASDKPVLISLEAAGAGNTAADFTLQNPPLSISREVDPSKGDLQIRFEKLPPTGLWIYEFNLEADEFRY